MEYTEKVDKQNINSILPAESALICFASFEERCTTLASYLDISKLVRAYVFRNCDTPMDNYNLKYFQILQMKLKHETLAYEEVKISLLSPVSLADSLYRTIQDVINYNIRNLLIDISAFTHEALLMLLKTLSLFQNSFDRIILIYNGASAYAEWLSKGCKNIRNVIGFPGRFNPSYKDHMIVLTGFEKERATQLVELFEPDILSIGNGSEPTDQNHLKTMEDMKKEFESWFGNLGVTWTSFDFSCSNILTTVDRIREEIKDEQENIVLVPLNTKLSTISAALVALQNERIQVVYPIPEIYNLSYSKPSNNFTFINLKMLLENQI